MATLFQYSCLENPMDRGAWQATVQGVAKSRTQLTNKHNNHSNYEKNAKIETCVLSRVKQITSPGWMHETSARGWCTGNTQRDRVETEVGGGIRMGNTCISMADSCQCMTKTITIL